MPAAAPKYLLLAVSTFAIVACSIKQDVRPVAAKPVDTLCVETNRDVAQPGFEPALVRQIAARSIAVQTVDRASREECATVMTYTANWRWDLALYLYYAELIVTDDSGEIGRAVYDAKQGGLNFGKFGRTEDKIQSLVTQLFP
ncbi:MAG: Sbal_3080 family lipoprotein [Pseudomonadota bacterium]